MQIVMKMKLRRRLKSVLAIFMAIAVLVTGLGLDKFTSLTEAAVSYTTLYLVDDTPEQWIGNDSAVIEMVDNTTGHDHYTMTRVNSTT